MRSVDTLQGEFPSAADVRPDVRERITALEAEYIAQKPDADPDVEGFASRYRELFQKENLSSASPEALLHFATSTTLANPGNTSGFTRAWETAGDDKAADGVRASIEHLLYGPESLRVEDRLTQLVEGKKGLGFPSFKEPMLTKVLAVVEPERATPPARGSRGHAEPQDEHRVGGGSGGQRRAGGGLEASVRRCSSAAGTSGLAAA